MSFELALRLTEILLALAFLQQSAENLYIFKSERIWHGARALASFALLAGFYAPFACLILLILSIYLLHRFNGPYNGGSDRMGALILACLTLALWLPEQKWQELAFGYLAIQLVLSYFIAGWVKLKNPEWRSGRALNDVFLYSAYPASQNIRGWANAPRLLLLMSWAVILFELLFPLTLVNPYILATGLLIAASFHLANALLFGLNRFFWIWIAAYPSLAWLQDRIF